MKSGWLIGAAVTLAAFGSVAACDDGDGSQIDFTLDGGNVALPDGGGGSDANVPKLDSGPTPTDSGPNDTGAQPDVDVPAQCNDGKVDLGETCDPLDKCPTDCPPQGCNLRTLENGGTCAAVCTTVAVQTQCQNGDGCCPTDCSIANDNDCAATCGNGVKEPGETCDGKDCPTDCPPIGCQVRKLVNGGTCTAECVDAQTPITTCNATSDQCCPATCNPGNDPDCAAGACGNGNVDKGETCDTGIKGSCPTSCAADKCQLFKLDNAGTCQAVCTASGTIDQCINGDGCCAKGCNNTNDSDCPAVCGNGVIEPPTETCDANCPTDCPAQGCQLYDLQNKGTCTAKCVAGATQTSCINSDGCCPAGCTNATDNDCAAQPPTCGNGKLDTGETCDNSDPKNPCPVCNTGTTCIGTKGSAATCDLVCDIPILTCSGKAADACCPFVAKDGSTCGSSRDADCNGTSWKAITFDLPLTMKADGECLNMTIDNVEAGGAYDVTTCSPSVTATGDVAIKGVVGSAGVILPPAGAAPQASTIRTIDYGSNDNCTNEKTAIPYRAGFTCTNKAGKQTMACVADGPGGFFAKNANPLTVTICAVGGGASVPFTVFYNSVNVPKLSAGP